MIYTRGVQDLVRRVGSCSPPKGDFPELVLNRSGRASDRLSHQMNEPSMRSAAPGEAPRTSPGFSLTIRQVWRDAHFVDEEILCEDGFNGTGPIYGSFSRLTP